MGKVMRHTLGASLNIRHNLSSSKGPKPLQLKLLTTYIPKTSAFTLAFSTSQRLRTTRASARTFFTFRHYITPSARNFCRVRNRRQLNSLQNTWPYGYSMPIAVRYTQDAFSRSGWLWPVDAKGEPLKATSYMAV